MFFKGNYVAKDPKLRAHAGTLDLGFIRELRIAIMTAGVIWGTEVPSSEQHAKIHPQPFVPLNPKPSTLNPRPFETLNPLRPCLAYSEGRADGGCAHLNQW